MVKNTDFTSLYDLAYNYINGTPTTPESKQKLKDALSANPPEYGILSEIALVSYILRETPFISHNQEIAWYILHQTMEEWCSAYDFDAMRNFFVEYATAPAATSDVYRPSMVARFCDNEDNWCTIKSTAETLNADYITSFPL